MLFTLPKVKALTILSVASLTPSFVETTVDEAIADAEVGTTAMIPKNPPSSLEPAFDLPAALLSLRCFWKRFLKKK